MTLSKHSGATCPVCNGVLIEQGRLHKSSYGYGGLVDEMRKCQDCKREFRIGFAPRIAVVDDELEGRLMETSSGERIRVLRDRPDLGKAVVRWEDQDNTQKPFRMKRKDLWHAVDEDGVVIYY